MNTERSPVITVHLVSETPYVHEGQGVHTAFMEMAELLKTENDIRLVVNNEGTGDVFHSHTYGPYYFWKGWRYEGRRILTVHVIPDSSKGTIPFWKQLMPLTRRYLKMAYAFADVVIAISPEVEKAITALGVKSRIVRINNPVIKDNWIRTDNNRCQGRKLLGITAHEKLIIGVGQLQQRKGVEDFIAIAEAMPEAQFVWVGGRPSGIFTEGISRIDKRIADAPANILFTGIKSLAEMPVMYAAADIFLFPSYQENCPLAPLEAAAAGLPVVYRDIPEYTSLYHCPYLKAKDNPGFVRLAKKLLADDVFYRNAKAISGVLLREFDQEKIRKQLICLYKETLMAYEER